MTLKQADVIRRDWGKFLEVTNGCLSEIFLYPIPEAFLPYPKKAIKESLTMVAKNFTDNGESEGAELAMRSIVFLDIYQDNEEALKKFSEKLKDEIFTSVIKKGFNKTQKKQLKYILENY